MSPADAVDITRESIWVLIKVAGPIMVIGLAVGLVVSLVQALTQIQEMTLAFVPKMLAIFAGLVLFMPFMIATMTTFMQQIAGRIASLP